VYDPTRGRFLSMEPPSPDGLDVLYEHPFAYAQNNPINRIDPSGRQAPGGAAEFRGCSDKESTCIQQAKKLAIDILRRNRDSCFSIVLRQCRSKCSAPELTDCAIDALNRSSFVCSDPDPAHRGSRGRTESLCAFFKGLAARGWYLSWGQLGACPIPCFSPIPNAANCSPCVVKTPIATILYRSGRPGSIIGIDKEYCPNKVRDLAVLLVHEASHNCVGGHDTTNPGDVPGPSITANSPTCDSCGRPDTFAIGSAFRECR
jgi:hypothetical protein